MKKPKNVPLYKRIYSEIAAHIVENKLVAGDFLPTREDLAQKYRTTRATVDRAMQELVAAGLIVGGSGRRTTVAGGNRQLEMAILVVWNEPRLHLDMGDFFFGPLAQGIHRACADFKVRAHFRDSDPARYIDDLKETKAQGILALRSDYSDIPALKKLWEQGIPVISLPGALENKTVPSIASDNVGGVEEAIGHLVSLGHQDIAFVSLAADVPDHFERLQGFLRAMAAHGLSINPHRVHLTHEIPQREYHEAIRGWLESTSLPTAILAADSMMGLALLTQLTAMGARVPQDVSILQFDDSPVAEHLPPAMTVIRQNVTQLGYLGVERLLQSIRGEEIPPVHRLPTSLVIRDSTSSPRT